MYPTPDLPHPLEGEMLDHDVPSTFAEDLAEYRAHQAETETQRVNRREYMLEVSGDTAGTDPAQLMPAREARFCRDFIDLVNHRTDRRHPILTVLSLQQAVGGGKLWGEEKANFGDKPFVAIYPGKRLHQGGLRKWATSVKYSPIPLRTVWTGEGFYIGYITSYTREGEKGITPAYLCTDGKVRCERDPQIFTNSLGLGYGTVPENLPLVPGALNWAIESGRVVFKNRYPAHLDAVLADYASWYPE
jgi:hypothetical protein